MTEAEKIYHRFVNYEWNEVSDSLKESILKAINEAKKKGKKNLEFLHVRKNEKINTEARFDVCTKTFVHPVIDNCKELFFSFKKINDCLAATTSAHYLEHELNP